MRMLAAGQASPSINLYDPPQRAETTTNLTRYDETATSPDPTEQYLTPQRPGQN